MTLSSNEIKIILENKSKILEATKVIIKEKSKPKGKRDATLVKQKLLELNSLLSILSSFSDCRGKQLINILTISFIQEANSNLDSNGFGWEILDFICYLANQINFDPYKKKFIWEGIEAGLNGIKIKAKWS